MPEVEIGMGRTARSAYELEDVTIVPSRRTRSSSDISTSWQIDAYRFEIPLLTQPTDAIVSPAVATAVSALGGLGVLDGEGLWARYPDPQRVIDQLLELGAAADDPDEVIAALQKAYSAPVSLDLLAEAIHTLRDGGGTVAIRLSPQNAFALAGPAIAAGVEMLIIQGTIVSAEHVQANGNALNLKSFIADLDVPVIVGGCSNYQTATHLMRTASSSATVTAGPPPPMTCWGSRCRWPRRSRMPLRPAGPTWTRPAAGTCMSSPPAASTQARTSPRPSPAEPTQ